MHNCCFAVLNSVGCALLVAKAPRLVMVGVEDLLKAPSEEVFLALL